MSTPINPLNNLLIAQATPPKPKTGSFFEAMARAWGEALDKQAATIEAQSNAINTSGEDKPSAMIELSAQSMKMQFFSSSAQSSQSAVGESLQTLARKG
jgi:hypothetical protein